MSNIQYLELNVVNSLRDLIKPTPTGNNENFNIDQLGLCNDLRIETSSYTHQRRGGVYPGPT